MTEFDSLIEHYGLDLKAWKDMTITNETRYDLDRNKLDYVKYYQLDEDLKYLVELDLQADIEFFKRCEDKWRH